MISERYLWSERVRMSARKVERAEALIPVRRRLMKAVFFFSAESSDLLVANTSALVLVSVSFRTWGGTARQFQFHPHRHHHHQRGVARTGFACPGSLIQVAELPCEDMLVFAGVSLGSGFCTFPLAIHLLCVHRFNRGVLSECPKGMRLGD